MVFPIFQGWIRSTFAIIVANLAVTFIAAYHIERLKRHLLYPVTAVFAILSIFSIDTSKWFSVIHENYLSVDNRWVPI